MSIKNRIRYSLAILWSIYSAFLLCPKDEWYFQLAGWISAVIAVGLTVWMIKKLKQPLKDDLD